MKPNRTKQPVTSRPPAYRVAAMLRGKLEADWHQAGLKSYLDIPRIGDRLCFRRSGKERQYVIVERILCSQPSPLAAFVCAQSLHDDTLLALTKAETTAMLKSLDSI
jgi:hypothetical protein